MQVVTGLGGATKVVHFSEAEATWNVIASDGVGYATLALLLAAGKVPWPGGDLVKLSIGTTLGISSEDANGNNGDDFFFAVNKGDADFGDLANDGLRDNLAQRCAAGGQVRHRPGRIMNVWVRKLTAADELILELSY